LTQPPPLSKEKTLLEKSTVQVESEQWTVHSPHQPQLQKINTPSPPQPTREKGGPFTAHWKLKLAATIFGRD